MKPLITPPDRVHLRNLIFIKVRHFLSLFFTAMLLFPSLANALEITGPTTICQGDNATYKVPAVTGLAYEWTTDSKGSMVSSSTIGSFSEGIIFWRGFGSSTITVDVKSGTSVVETIYLTVEVLPRPRPVITWDVEVGCQIENPLEDPDDPAETDIGSGVCTKVCEKSIVTYSVPEVAGSTYVWTVSGGTATPSGNTCVVEWGDAGAGSIEVVETSAGGCVGRKAMCIEIVKKPVAEFLVMTDVTASFPTPIQVCLFDKVTFKDMSSDNGGTELISWYWDFGDGTTSSEKDPSHIYSTDGSYEVTLTVTNACNCKAEYKMRIIVDPSAGVKIICPRLACENATEKYSVIDACGVYDWSVIGGTIVSAPPPYTNEIQIQWDAVDATGFGYVILDATTCSVPCPNKTVLKIPVIKSTGTITGKTVICTNKQYRYTLPQWPATNYNWSVSAGSTGAIIIHTDQPNEVLIQGTSAGSITLSCNYDNNLLLGCSGSASINIDLEEPPTITGDDLICIDETRVYTLSSGASATWILEGPEGKITFGPSTSFSHLFALSGTYRLRAEGLFCWPEPLEIKVSPKPTAPDKISGPAKICLNVPFLFTAEDGDGESVFQWSVSGGGGTFNTTTGSKVSFTATSGASWTISVHRKNKKAPQCEGPAITKVVVVDYVEPIIRGRKDPCEYSYQYYATDFTNAENYEWTITPPEAGSVVLDEHTYNPKIVWNKSLGGSVPVYIDVKVTKCNMDYTRQDTVFVKTIADFTPVVNFDPYYCPGKEVNPYMTGGTDDKGGTMTVSDWDDFSEIEDPEEVRHWYKDEGSITTKTVKLSVIAPGGCAGSVDLTRSFDLRPSPKVYGYPKVTKVCYDPLGAPVMLVDTTSSLDGGFIFSWKDVPTDYHQLGIHAGYSTEHRDTLYVSTSLKDTTYYYIPTVVDIFGCEGTDDIVKVIVEDCDLTGEGGDPCVPSYATTISPTSETTPYNMTANQFFVDCNGQNKFEITRPSLYYPYPDYDRWSDNVEGYNAEESSSGGLTYVTFNVPKEKVGKYTFVLLSNYYTAGGTTYKCPQYQDFFAINPLYVNVAWDLSCGTGGKYDVVFKSTSEYYPSTLDPTTFNYHWVLQEWNVGLGSYITKEDVGFGSITFTPSLPLDPGTKYKITLELTSSPAVCTQSFEFETPALPVADFNVMYTPTCDGTPVYFQTTSTPDPSKLVHFWDFGDGTDNYHPERTYTYDVSDLPFPNSRDVKLTVTDKYGCFDESILKTVVVNQNTLGGSLAAVPTLACPDETVTLTFTDGALKTTPNLYNWIRDEKTRIASTTGNTYGMTTPEPGLYWTEVRNANRCRARTTNSVVVDVVGVPDVSINGKSDVCSGEEFELNAYAGDDIISYVWEKKDPWGSFSTVTDGVSPDHDFTETLTTAGVYTYRVTISVLKGAGPAVCTRTSAEFEVTVHDPPVTPTLGYTMMDCTTYELELTATSSSTGVYTWSNGMSGSPVYVRQGGPYKVILTDEFGCTASEQMDILKDPKSYLWIFPSGCYSLCPAPNFTLYGPVIPFANWEWRKNYSAVSTGSGDVTPYALSSSGVYNLYLDNGLCNATSEDLNFDAVGCSATDCSQNLLLNVTSVTYSGACRATIHMTATRPMFPPVPVPYTISASMGGYLIPVGGTNPVTIPVGTTPLHFEWVAPSPLGFPSGSLAEFIITINLPGGGTCTTKVQILMNCPSGPILYRTTDSGSIIANGSLLTLAPNPAQSMTNINYSYGADAQEGTKNLVVCDMTGRVLSNYPLTNNEGKLELHFGDWASGIYQIALLQNGKVVQTSKLSVVR